jgi:hypothetical protein
VNASRSAAAYVGLFGIGKSLVSVGAMGTSIMDGDPIGTVLRDPERRKEVDAILEECRSRVRTLLRQKRHAVEGVRDALLGREELVGDEIEALMADLGEREPIVVGAALPASSPGAFGDGYEGGNGASGNGHRGLGDGVPPRPDRDD